MIKVPSKVERACQCGQAASLKAAVTTYTWKFKLRCSQNDFAIAFCDLVNVGHFNTIPKKFEIKSKILTKLKSLEFLKIGKVINKSDKVRKW